MPRRLTAVMPHAHFVRGPSPEDLLDRRYGRIERRFRVRASDPSGSPQDVKRQRRGSWF